MAIVSEYGRSDLFLTCTFSSKIPRNYRKHRAQQSSKTKPDEEVRVYKLQFNELTIYTRKRHVLGVPIAHIHVIEFQKRGLPHCRIPIMLREEDKIIRMFRN